MGKGKEFDIDPESLSEIDPLDLFLVTEDEHGLTQIINLIEHVLEQEGLPEDCVIENLHVRIGISVVLEEDPEQKESLSEIEQTIRDFLADLD